jgi:hypothetical protein
MQLVPTLGPQLLQLLVQNLPHKLRDRSTQCLYLRGAMALAEGPAGRPVRDGLLLGLVDHLLSIDVEIKWEDIVDVRTGGADRAVGAVRVGAGVGTGPGRLQQQVQSSRWQCVNLHTMSGRCRLRAMYARCVHCSALNPKHHADIEVLDQGTFIPELVELLAAREDRGSCSSML